MLATASTVGAWLLLAPRPIAGASTSAFLSATPWERASLVGVVIAGPAIALWALLAHRSPSRALAWIAGTLALVFLLGTGIYSASQPSSNSIRAFANHVRGSLERDAPIMAFPDAGLIFDLYLDRSIVEVPRRDRVARRLESPAAGEVLMRVGDWAYFRRSAHPSWCSIGDVELESRSYVLLGSCR